MGWWIFICVCFLYSNKNSEVLGHAPLVWGLRSVYFEKSCVQHFWYELYACTKPCLGLTFEPGFLEDQIQFIRIHDPQWESEALFSQVGLAWKSLSFPKQNPIMSFLEEKASLIVWSGKCYGEVSSSDSTWSLKPNLFIWEVLQKRFHVINSHGHQLGSWEEGDWLEGMLLEYMA